MTELAVPLWAGPNPTVPGTCGRPREGFALRIVDTEGNDVPVGSSGELIVRAHDPWTISHGYLRDAGATASAWRDGWFHTGDLFRRDAEENYFFVDRIKDAIRRRGENVSSFEVERAILEHPAVREAAVVAVPAGSGAASRESARRSGAEDEVLAVVALKPGATLSAADLISFLRERLAPFMIPRYVRFLEELPRTPTQKVEKHALRQAGVTADTWDRETAGIRIGRDRLPQR
jgi:crotonobetaine/carnitine-CoA ligase